MALLKQTEIGDEPTSIASSADLRDELHVLDTKRCSHGLQGHAEKAHGRDAEGMGRANRASAYPAQMCTLLAQCICTAMQRKRAASAAEPAPSVIGGRVTDGVALSASIHAACEHARDLKPRFASLRNMLASTEAELRAEALPGNLHAPMRRTKPPRAKASRKGKVHPAAIAVDAAAALEAGERPVGRTGTRRWLELRR